MLQHGLFSKVKVKDVRDGTDLSMAAAKPMADGIPSAKDPLLLLTPEIQYWNNDIYRWAKEYDIPMELIGTVMQIESCGHPAVVSNSGAIGLFQVMPFHFHLGENPSDPDTNALRGLRYLSKALDLSNGEPALALAGYNGGHSVIHQDPQFWPEETQRYVRWGLSILQDLTEGGEQSHGVREWLAAGGGSLCLKAMDYQASQEVGDLD
jgi:soluble lytic murein transglycosylase-like protein